MRRRRLADAYVRTLHEAHGIEIAFAGRPDRSTAAHHLAVAVLPEGVDRDGCVRRSTAEGIQTSVHYPPIHTFSAYVTDGDAHCPAPTRSPGRLLTLPLYPGLTDELVQFVSERLVAAVAQAPLSRASSTAP